MVPVSAAADGRASALVTCDFNSGQQCSVTYLSTYNTAIIHWILHAHTRY